MEEPPACGVVSRWINHFNHLVRERFPTIFCTAATTYSAQSNLLGFDHFRVHEVLGTPSCVGLFGEHRGLVHYTSALRYPVFQDGRDYAGSAAMLRHPLLRRMVRVFTAAELEHLPSGLLVPLGGKVAEVLAQLADEGRIDRARILGRAHRLPARAQAAGTALDQGERGEDRRGERSAPRQDFPVPSATCCGVMTVTGPGGRIAMFMGFCALGLALCALTTAAAADDHTVRDRNGRRVESVERSFGAVLIRRDAHRGRIGSVVPDGAGRFVLREPQGAGPTPSIRAPGRPWSSAIATGVAWVRSTSGGASEAE